MKLVSILWRTFVTAIGFIIFGLGGLFIAICIFPPYNFFVQSPSHRKNFARKVIRYSFSLFIYFLKILGAINYQYIGFNKLNNQKDTIIIANHPSLLDFVILAAKIEHCSCIVKGALLKNFFLKRIVKAADYIPNSSDTDTLIHLCNEQLVPEDFLLIFPEGTRTTYSKPISLQRGAANIALRTNRDIQIIHISLSAPMLTKEIKWYKVPPIKPLFTLQVGEKIHLKDHIDISKSINIQARELTEALKIALQSS